MEVEIYLICKNYSMISKERFDNNIFAVKYIEENNIPGDIIEIGVWKGGSILSMMLTYEKINSEISRNFHLYDTFEGMTESSEFDKDNFNTPARDLLGNPLVAAICNLNAVIKNISSHTKIQPSYHIGDILKNKFVPKQIAILRLDTDWYESTKYELDTFYENVSPGGIVIIDDYGHWQGCKKAVDEFLFLHPEIKLETIDYTGRFFIKPQQNS